MEEKIFRHKTHVINPQCMTLKLIAKLFLEIVASPSKNQNCPKDFDKTIGHEMDRKFH